jgi:LysM repeat protein
MSRSLAACLALVLIAAADGPPLPHASGAPAGPGPGCGGTFTAARGDTLYSIARRCESTVTELVQENRLGDPPVLAAGQRLAIPGFAREEAPKPPEAAPPPPPPPARLPPVEVRRMDNVYLFQAGDTLYSLARWARTSLAALRAANPGIDARDIDAGTAINLPRGAVRPEPMRLRERGRPAPAPPPSRAAPPPPPRARPVPPPPAPDEAGKPKPDDEDGDATPGGMDDGAPAPDGM